MTLVLREGHRAGTEAAIALLDSDLDLVALADTGAGEEGAVDVDVVADTARADEEKAPGGVDPVARRQARAAGQGTTVRLARRAGCGAAPAATAVGVAAVGVAAARAAAATTSA